MAMEELTQPPDLRIFIQITYLAYRYKFRPIEGPPHSWVRVVLECSSYLKEMAYNLE